MGIYTLNPNNKHKDKVWDRLYATSKRHENVSVGVSTDNSEQAPQPATMPLIFFCRKLKKKKQEKKNIKNTLFGAIIDL